MNNQIKEMRKYLLEKNVEDIALMTDDEVKEKYEELNKKGIENYKIFEPKDGERYWHINDICAPGLSGYDADYIDNDRKQIGNMFETREEVEQIIENLKVRQELKELSNEISTEKVDWKDDIQSKYCLVYDYSSKEVSWYVAGVAGVANTVYFVGINGKKLIETAKERIGEERLINYLKGC